MDIHSDSLSQREKILLSLLALMLVILLVIIIVSLTFRFQETVDRPLSRKNIFKSAGGIYYSPKCWESEQRPNSCAVQFIVSGSEYSEQLYRLLGEHPSVSINKNRTIECLFTNTSNEGEKDLVKTRETDSEVTHYLAQFDKVPIHSEAHFLDKIITGDHCLSYFDEEQFPQLLTKYLPTVKVIFMIEHPIDRALHQFQTWRNSEAFDMKFPLSDEEVFVSCFAKNIEKMANCRLMDFKQWESWRKSSYQKCYTAISETPSFDKVCLENNDCFECPHNLAFQSVYFFSLQSWWRSYDLVMLNIQSVSTLFRAPNETIEQLEDFLHLRHADIDWDARLRTLMGKREYPNYETLSYESRTHLQNLLSPYTKLANQMIKSAF